MCGEKILRRQRNCVGRHRNALFWEKTCCNQSTAGGRKKNKRLDENRQFFFKGTWIIFQPWMFSGKLWSFVREYWWKTFQVDFWHPLFFVTTWGSKRDPNYSYRSSLFHTLEDDKATLPAQHSPKSNARVDHWSSKFHQKTRKKWRGDHIFLQSPQWKMPDYLSLIMLVSFFLYIAEESQSREDRSWWTCRERAHRTVCTWQTWTWGEVWLLHTRNNMVVKDNRDGQPPKKYHHLLLLRWHVVMFVTLKRKGGVILFVTY